MVRLCPNGAELLNWILTFPAEAVTLVCWKRRAPPGSAAMCTWPAPPEALPAPAELVVDCAVAAVVAAVPDELELELELEPPQPAAPNATAAASAPKVVIVRKGLPPGE